MDIQYITQNVLMQRRISPPSGLELCGTRRSYGAKLSLHNKVRVPMLSTITLVLHFVSIAVSMEGYRIRQKKPRLALFLLGAWPIGAGVWFLASTYELYLQGKAHTISRHYQTISKAANPSGFDSSVVFHAALGSVLLILGLLCMVAAIRKKEVRFPK